ncbi:unnamed protein product, partial [Rotaria magnacalcarata]
MVISPCNAIQTCNASLNSNVEALVKTIENEKYRNNLRTLLVRFSATFDISKHNIAKTSIHHVINTVPHSPPACKPYPQPDKEQAMYQLMQEFLQAGLITESHSPYAAPPILIKKKDSSYRFVVDYKKLNLITIKDSSPLPNMEDTIRKLGHGYSCFSKLDLKSGFYQISINNADKEKTAFVTPFGLYQFNVLPMGLKNSPPTFQKVMTDTLKNCRNYSLVYLDDIIIFSKSFEQHLCHLECVISALKEKNLVLNPPKCVFATNKIDYLGHTVSKKYITPMKEKIEAILQLKEPHSLSQANKFIGALSWYRKFIPHFATVAAPIHSVTNLTKDNRHKFKWKYAQSKVFHELKQILVREPLFLHYPIDDIPLILTTAASGIGIGGVLQQEVEGEMHNLYYHSQLMTICERRNIILKTDHCPLCHIMEKTVRNARVDRITQLLQEYNIDKNEINDDPFEIDYGLENKDNLNESELLSPLISQSSSSSYNKKDKNLLATMVLRSRFKQHKSHTTTGTSNNKVINHDEEDNQSQQMPRVNKSFIRKFSHNEFDLTNLKQEQENDSIMQNIVKELHTRRDNIPF